MAWGPGRYDPLATVAREAAEAEGVILIVVQGKFGDGFSAQLSALAIMAMPTYLRQLADQIERSGPGRGGN